jgi:hypothetical protein
MFISRPILCRRYLETSTFFFGDSHIVNETKRRICRGAHSLSDRLAVEGAVRDADRPLQQRSCEHYSHMPTRRQDTRYKMQAKKLTIGLCYTLVPFNALVVGSQCLP